MYGRTKGVRKADLTSTTQHKVERENWQVLIRNAHPGYISWDEFLANQQRLRENRFRKESKGAPRTGGCLLGGLVHCGHCGDRLKVTYRSDPQRRQAGLYGCRSSCDLFGIGRYDLIEQVQDIITVGEFYAMAAGGQIIFT